MFTSSIKRRRREFHFVVVQGRQRNVQKVCCTCKAAVLLIKPTALLTFSSPSLKPPIVLACSRRSETGEGAKQSEKLSISRQSPPTEGLEQSNVVLAPVPRSALSPGLSPYKMGGEKPWRRGCPKMCSSNCFSNFRVSVDFFLPPVARTIYLERKMVNDKKLKIQEYIFVMTYLPSLM